MISKQGLCVRLLAVALLSTGLGCERQFADESAPVVEILEPDPSQIFTDPNVEVRLKEASNAQLTRVDAGSVPMVFDSFTDTWMANIVLHPGINRLVIRSFSEFDVPKTDTLFLFQMPFEVTDAASQFRLPLAGHTVTPVSGGGLVAMGGVASASGPAENRAFFLPNIQDGAFLNVSSNMLHARVGHTATRINDRRLLILGGASKAAIESVSDLVEAPELYFVDDRIFVPLHFEGEPIRRMYHTAVYRNSPEGPTVDIIGGTGDVQYTPEPLLGTRNDIRSFLLRNDTLFAKSTAIGPRIETLSGHTQSDLSVSPFGQPGLFILSGQGGSPAEGPVRVFVNFNSPNGIDVFPAPMTRIPRTHHSAALIGFQLVGLFGGTQINAGAVLKTAELYDHETGRSFLFPEGPQQSLRRRFLHTATVVGANLIMIAGGLDENGDIVDTIEFISYSL